MNILTRNLALSLITYGVITVATDAASQKSPNANGPHPAAASVEQTLIQNAGFALNDQIEGKHFVLLWNGSQLLLAVNNSVVEDLETDRDDEGRIQFAGAFDNDGMALVHGYIAAHSANELMVVIRREGFEPIRVITSQGMLLRKEECTCWGNADNKKDCKDADCDISTDCHKTVGGTGTANCSWRESGLDNDGPIQPTKERISAPQVTE